MDNDKRLYGNFDEYKFKINGETENLEETMKKRNEEELTEGMKKYMPIGSIVVLNGSDTLRMIIGFNYSNSQIVYDYISCLYPFGVNMEKSTLAFNHDQIDRVYHIGYINSQERAFKSQIGLNKPENGMSK